MARKKYTCPYCFYQFREFDIKTSAKGIRYNHCPNPGVDENNHQICNRYLPDDFTDHDAKIIAIFGGVAAGKSTYIASAFKMLTESDDVVQHLGLNASYLDEDDHSEEMVNNYWDKMMAGEFPDGSSTKDMVKFKRPIILSLENSINNRKTYLTFFDTPGREFENKKNIAEEYPYICNADAILFFMDPLQIKSMQDLILDYDIENEEFKFKEYAENPINRIRVEKVVNNLSSAIRTTFNNYSMSKSTNSIPSSGNINIPKESPEIERGFNIYSERYRKKIGRKTNSTKFKVPIPTAFCISKYDFIAGRGTVYGFNNFIYTDKEFFISESPEDGWISHIINNVEDDSKNVHDFLNENDIRLYKEITSKFSTYKIMGVAAACAEDRNINKVKLIRGEPVTKNLLHPLIWVLNELKFFK